jgi:hypothetical protein
MNVPENPTALPLEYAAELAFELHLLRGECSQTAQRIISQHPVDALELDDCAKLDEALAKAYCLLQSTVNRIRESRAQDR